ncbi:ABC transporter permease [Hoyosella altamirensis]|uniref:Peptide/nickel transport system permease protein n=1 Tax=Hoyosella altamirensis TaxID=616997 RepID=A0A839RSQ1_9ACTN|nr:ABC transporter permease [Hoyosella altamirensis]MBB3039094.1 peptide/nickel transport system permease protein [Hoyosella altamirensis]
MTRTAAASQYLAGRLAGRVLLCLAATFFAFALASMTFDPMAELQMRQPPPPPGVLEAQAARLALDSPIPLRFLEWIAGFPSGDFGTTVGGRPIGDELWSRAGTSMRLFFAGSIVAILLGVVVGVRSALNSRHASDHLTMFWTLALLAIPVFVLGTLLKLLWLPINEAAGTQILYFSGESTVGANYTGWEAVLDRIRHMVLPTLAIALPQIAYFSRYQRAAMLEILNSDFVRTARAKGLRWRQAVRIHALRVALIPMVSLFAFSFGLHIVGGVFTERIFGWHGMGDWLLTGIHDHDARIVAMVTLFIGVVIVIAGWLSDIVLVMLDPRIRTDGAT